ncbi:hypothetical protein AAZX31_09G220500 [Glycine max]|nr:hypothetical protein GLYMA_09G240900v4 [Glycine max]
MGSAFSALFGRGSTVAEGSSESLHVLPFHSSERWQLHFNEVKETSKLVVIDFTASWCGPCRFIAPVFNEMAKKFSNAEFVKIDVDELPVILTSLIHSN